MAPPETQVSPPATTKLFDLPDELIEQVLRRIHPEKLSTMAQVCTRFRKHAIELMRTDHYGWRARLMLDFNFSYQSASLLKAYAGGSYKQAYDYTARFIDDVIRMLRTECVQFANLRASTDRIRALLYLRQHSDLENWQINCQLDSMSESDIRLIGTDLTEADVENLNPFQLDGLITANRWLQKCNLPLYEPDDFLAYHRFNTTSHVMALIAILNKTADRDQALSVVGNLNSAYAFGLVHNIPTESMRDLNVFQASALHQANKVRPNNSQFSSTLLRGAVWLCSRVHVDAFKASLNRGVSEHPILKAWAENDRQFGPQPAPLTNLPTELSALLAMEPARLYIILHYRNLPLARAVDPTHSAEESLTLFIDAYNEMPPHNLRAGQVTSRIIKLDATIRIMRAHKLNFHDLVRKFDGYLDERGKDWLIYDGCGYMQYIELRDYFEYLEPLIGTMTVIKHSGVDTRLFCNLKWTTDHYSAWNHLVGWGKKSVSDAFAVLQGVTRLEAGAITRWVPSESVVGFNLNVFHGAALIRYHREGLTGQHLSGLDWFNSEKIFSQLVRLINDGLSPVAAIQEMQRLHQITTESSEHSRVVPVRGAAT